MHKNGTGPLADLNGDADAHTLTTALGAHPTDHATALGRYETVHLARVTPKQRAIYRSAAVLAPKRLSLATRNLAVRLWSGASDPSRPNAAQIAVYVGGCCTTRLTPTGWRHNLKSPETLQIPGESELRPTAK